MSNLVALFELAVDGHPGSATCCASPNVFVNGKAVLIKPTWVCYHIDPPHPSGTMAPTTETVGVFINGNGAGWVEKSVAPCGATIPTGATNVFIG